MEEAGHTAVVPSPCCAALVGDIEQKLSDGPELKDGKGTDVHKAAVVGDIEQKISDGPELKESKGTVAQQRSSWTRTSERTCAASW